MELKPLIIPETEPSKIPIYAYLTQVLRPHPALPHGLFRQLPIPLENYLLLRLSLRGPPLLHQFLNDPWPGYKRGGYPRDTPRISKGIADCASALIRPESFD